MSMPAIVISGLMDARLKQASKEQGAFRCFQKPVDLDALPGRYPRGIDSAPMEEIKTRPSPASASWIEAGEKDAIADNSMPALRAGETGPGKARRPNSSDSCSAIILSALQHH